MLPFLITLIISLLKATLLFGLLIITVGFLFLLYIAWIRGRYAHIPGPPIKHFFLANGSEYLSKEINRQDLIIQWSQQYGSVFKFIVAHKVTLVVTTPDLAEYLLRCTPKSKEIYSMVSHTFGVRAVGRGIGAELNISKWRVRRKAVEPNFHRAFLYKDLNTVFNDVADELVYQLSLREGESIDLGEFLQYATIQAIAKIAFSFDIQLVGQDSKHFSRAISLVMKSFSPVAKDPTFAYKPWNRQSVKEMQDAALFVRTTCREKFNERLLSIINENKHPDDILTSMVKNYLSHLGDGMIDMEDVIDDMFVLFIAGHETTSSTLAFVFRVLGQKAELKETVVEEVDSLLILDNFVSAEDLNEKVWLDATIKETLRLYSVATSIFREVEGGTKLNGYRIPMLTNVMIAFYPIHYLHTKKGDEFLPERFVLSDKSLAPPAFGNIPFSHGSRSCLGRHFAINEMKMILAKLLHNFEFEQTSSVGDRIDMVENTTCYPLGGVPCVVRRRFHRDPA